MRFFPSLLEGRNVHINAFEEKQAGRRDPLYRVISIGVSLTLKEHTSVPDPGKQSFEPPKMVGRIKTFEPPKMVGRVKTFEPPKIVGRVKLWLLYSILNCLRLLEQIRADRCQRFYLWKNARSHKLTYFDLTKLRLVCFGVGPFRRG